MATFHVGQKTHPGVLPQLRALESASADTPRNRDETGRGSRRLTVASGVEHVRGETTTASPGDGGVTPVRQGREKVYTRTRPDRYGFPRFRFPRQKTFFGFQTGDLVRTVVPAGKRAGAHTGRVAVRARGNFNIRTPHGTVQGIGHRHVRLLQRADGYGYTTKKEAGASFSA